jgi:hypothetical protein
VPSHGPHSLVPAADSLPAESRPCGAKSSTETASWTLCATGTQLVACRVPRVLCDSMAQPTCQEPCGRMILHAWWSRAPGAEIFFSVPPMKSTAALAPLKINTLQKCCCLLITNWIKCVCTHKHTHRLCINRNANLQAQTAGTTPHMRIRLMYVLSRRHGHNELDEPSLTQPLTYTEIQRCSFSNILMLSPMHWLSVRACTALPMLFGRTRSSVHCTLTCWHSTRQSSTASRLVLKGARKWTLHTKKHVYMRRRIARYIDAWLKQVHARVSEQAPDRAADLFAAASGRGARVAGAPYTTVQEHRARVRGRIPARFPVPHQALRVACCKCPCSAHSPFFLYAPLPGHASCMMRICSAMAHALATLRGSREAQVFGARFLILFCVMRAVGLHDYMSDVLCCVCAYVRVHE